MKLLAALTLSALAMPALAAEHQVDGHFRKDGTYVAPHYQTNPNNTIRDNYGTQGNYNPHTGQVGTVNPYAQPQQPAYQPYGQPRQNRGAGIP